jgi:hypothetical protein
VAHDLRIEAAPQPRPLYRRWWLWTAVAAAVLGIGAAVAWAALSTGPSAPVLDFPPLGGR